MACSNIVGTTATAASHRIRGRRWVSLGKEDVSPLSPGKASSPAMGLPELPPATLLAENRAALCWTAQIEVGRWIW